MQLAVEVGVGPLVVQVVQVLVEMVVAITPWPQQQVLLIQAVAVEALRAEVVVVRVVLALLSLNFQQHIILLSMLDSQPTQYN
jgi:hypothetical protein